ncbi:MAG TPA: permease-like cell division protein FtsX [Vicinamibacterales bacterium]
MRLLGFALDEAARSVWRRRGASLMAVLAAGASLFVLGLLLLAATATAGLLARWTEAAEISVFLRDDVTAEARAAIEQALDRSDLVAQRAYVSSDEALRRFASQFPDLAASAALETNPLPASYDVRLRPERARDPAVDDLVASLRTLAGVSDVQYDRHWIDRLLTAVATIRTAGAMLAIVLVLAACLTITAVVRLALHARLAEIEIMQLVGAPLAYIRGPFVLEGTLLGLGGAVLALLALWAGFLAARGHLAAWADSLAAGGAAVGFLPLWAILTLAAGGAVIGCLGGLLGARAAR